MILRLPKIEFGGFRLSLRNTMSGAIFATIQLAVMNGDIDTLSRLHKHAVLPMDPVKVALDTHLCSLAAQFNKIGVLRWAHENGYKMNAPVAIIAAYHRNYVMLKWIMANTNCPISDYILAFIIAHDDTALFDDATLSKMKCSFGHIDFARQYIEFQKNVDVGRLQNAKL